MELLGCLLGVAAGVVVTVIGGSVVAWLADSTQDQVARRFRK